MSTENKKSGFLKGIKSEYGKVTWPKKDEVMKSTAVVLFSVLTIAVISKLLSLLFGFLLSFTV